METLVVTDVFLHCALSASLILTPWASFIEKIAIFICPKRQLLYIFFCWCEWNWLHPVSENCDCQSSKESIDWCSIPQVIPPPPASNRRPTLYATCLPQLSSAILHCHFKLFDRKGNLYIWISLNKLTIIPQTEVEERNVRPEARMNYNTCKFLTAFMTEAIFQTNTKKIDFLFSVGLKKTVYYYMNTELWSRMYMYNRFWIISEF